MMAVIAQLIWRLSAFAKRLPLGQRSKAKFAHLEDWATNYASTTKKQTLVRYFTIRYVLTLVIGLAVVASISVLWLRTTAMEQRLQMMTLVSQEFADRILTDGNELTVIPDLTRKLRERGVDLPEGLMLMLVNTNGDILYRAPRPLLFDQNQFLLSNPSETIERRTLPMEEGTMHIVAVPVRVNEAIAGYVYAFQSEKALKSVRQPYWQLGIMITLLGVLGWAVIYWLSKQMIAPIRRVAAAAHSVRDGDYNIVLEDASTEEMDELVVSFRTMSQRLQQMERLRYELLAGVTHELKTPITSISGLLQAINDDIVEGEEAREFQQIAFNESQRMKQLILDLLDFNTFASGKVAMKLERVEFVSWLRRQVHEWQLVHPQTEMTFHSTVETAVVEIDSARMQQVVMNLWNNAMQAMNDKGRIDCQLVAEEDHLQLTVRDYGCGIDEADQPYIFERFYRGKKKQETVRGLGLGLPFSKMMVEGMNGQLQVESSGAEGTTFSVYLPL